MEKPPQSSAQTLHTSAFKLRCGLVQAEVEPFVLVQKKKNHQNKIVKSGHRRWQEHLRRQISNREIVYTFVIFPPRRMTTQPGEPLSRHK